MRTATLSPRASCRGTVVGIGLLAGAVVTLALGRGPVPAAAVAADDPSQSKSDKPPSEPTPEEKAALAEGQALFRGLCSG